MGEGGGWVETGKVGNGGGGEKGRWGEWEEGRRVGGKGSRWEVGDRGVVGRWWGSGKEAVGR